MAEHDDIRELVDGEVRRLLDNAAVEAEYPDLKDRSSEFFQKTALEMRNLPKDLAGGRVRAAAQSVELDMRRHGIWKEPARAPAAGGGRGPEPEGDGTPSASQADIAAQIIGGDRGEAIEAYKARAEGGVNVSLGGSLAAQLGRGPEGE
jgi:hypothetical protein